MLYFNIKSQEQPLSLEITLPAQGVTALYGPSGAGKSTCFNVIAGLKRYKDVEIRINDTVWQDTQYFMPLDHRGVALVRQRPYLFPHLSVLNNLTYPFRRRESLLSIDELIKQFDLSALLNKQPKTLSGGELQRIAIVQALLSNPKLILFDEAFSAMDDEQKGQFIQTLKTHLACYQCAVMMISHDIAEIACLADRVIMLSSGKIERILNKDEFLAHQPMRQVVKQSKVTEAVTRLTLQNGETILIDSKFLMRLQLSE